MAERETIWDRIERWATRQRGEEEGSMQPTIAADPDATERLERAEKLSAEALDKANTAIEAVHELEAWMRGRDRRRRDRGRVPDRRRPTPRPPLNLAHATITTRHTGRRLQRGAAR